MAHVWYPSCKVRLMLRFEDFVVEAIDPSPAELGEPEAFGGQTYETLKIDVIPLNAGVTRNSYREADTAVVTLPFRVFPFDPRTVRAISMQIFCGAVDPKEYADGVGPMGGQSQIVLVPDVTVEGASNEVFRGFADTLTIEQDDDQEAVVRIDARDLTGIFLDAEMPAQGLAKLPKTLPLDVAIQQIIQGEAVASTLPAASVAKIEAASRQDARGLRRAATARLNAVNAKLVQLTNALGTSTNPGVIASISAEIVTLTARQADLAAIVSLTTTEEVKGEAVPILAHRFGLPGARGTRVVNETRSAVLPNLGELKGLKYFDSKKTAKKSRTRGSRETISYWDFITDLCVSAGYTVYIRSPRVAAVGGLPAPPEIVITEPRTYYGDAAPRGDGAPAEPEELHEFVFGVNVGSLRVERALTGKNVPKVIEVLARADNGKLYRARFPATDRDKARASSARKNRVYTSKNGDREEVATLTYRGAIPEAKAQKVLGQIARKVYEELGRGEFRVTISTDDMAFRPSNRDDLITGSPVNVDIFELRAGGSIRVRNLPTSTTDVLGGQVTQRGVFEALDVASRIQIFKSLGMSDFMAIELANTYESDGAQRLPDVFRVSEVGITFDSSEGFDFEIKAVNYLDARNAVDSREDG